MLKVPARDADYCFLEPARWRAAAASDNSSATISRCSGVSRLASSIFFCASMSPSLLTSLPLVRELFRNKRVTGLSFTARGLLTRPPTDTPRRVISPCEGLLRPRVARARRVTGCLLHFLPHVLPLLRHLRFLRRIALRRLRYHHSFETPLQKRFGKGFRAPHSYF